MALDKRLAKFDAYRIPEKWFFTICLIGGIVGVILGMFVFHHKSKKKEFQLFVLGVLVFYAAVLVSLTPRDQ